LLYTSGIVISRVWQK